MGGPAEVPGSIPGAPGSLFWSGRGQLFVICGMSWEVSGSGLGTFLDGIGMVLIKMLDGTGNVGWGRKNEHSQK